VLIEARGDVFSVPAENGYVKNMTRTSGSANGILPGRLTEAALLTGASVR